MTPVDLINTYRMVELDLNQSREMWEVFQCLKFSVSFTLRLWDQAIQNCDRNKMKMKENIVSLGHIFARIIKNTDVSLMSFTQNMFLVVILNSV